MLRRSHYSGISTSRGYNITITLHFKGITFPNHCGCCKIFAVQVTGFSLLWFAFTLDGGNLGVVGRLLQEYCFRTGILFS